MEHAARLCSNLGNRGARRVIDHDVQARELVCATDELGPLVILDMGRANLLQAHARLGRQQALGDLDLAHLEREERDGGAVERRIHGKVQREGGFAHAGSRANDDHLARSQTQELGVDGGEACPDAQLGGLVLAHVRELVEEIAHDGADGLVARAHIPVGNVEQHLLGLVNDLLGVLGSIVGKRGDLRGGRDHPAQRGVTAQHLHVTAPAHQSQRVVAKIQEIGPAAHALQLALALEEVCKRDGVHRHVAVEHLAHGKVDLAVGGNVEVIRLQLDEAFLQHVLRDHHGGEDRGLGLGVLRHRNVRRRRHLGWVDVVAVLCHEPTPSCLRAARLPRMLPHCAHVVPLSAI